MLIPLRLPASDPNLWRLIPAEAPTRPRALAVLGGRLSGFAWADDIALPRSLLVLEDADGTTYGGGALTAEAVAATLGGLVTRSGDVIVGFSGADDPARGWVPVNPYWTGKAIDFTTRVAALDEAARIDAAVPDGMRLASIDAMLLPRTEWYEDTVHAFGSVDRWLQHGIGWALLAGDEIVAEALAGPEWDGTWEMGVVTRALHRGRGYGTLVSRATARACEARGGRVWWNANADNLPSLGIARRIGFSRERSYDLAAWHAPLPS